MSKLSPILLALPLGALIACAPSPEQRGTVTQINSASVTIRGVGDYSLGNIGNQWQPTPAMVEQAREICPNATFVGGTADPDRDFMVDYLFRC